MPELPQDDYDATFYLVTADRSKRLGDPGTELYSTDFEPVTKDDIIGKYDDVRIVMLTPSDFENVKIRAMLSPGITWKDPALYLAQGARNAVRYSRTGEPATADPG
jgi:hypothetical protein